MGVIGDTFISGYGPELTGHPQIYEQRSAFGEYEDNVFTAAVDLLDLAAFDCRDNVIYFRIRNALGGDEGFREGLAD